MLPSLLPLKVIFALASLCSSPSVDTRHVDAEWKIRLPAAQSLPRSLLGIEALLMNSIANLKTHFIVALSPVYTGLVLPVDVTSCELEMIYVCDWTEPAGEFTRTTCQYLNQLLLLM